MSMIDKTGQPRTGDDIRNAIKAINAQFLAPTKVPPQLFVELACIKESLEELLLCRESISEAKIMIKAEMGDGEAAHILMVKWGGFEEAAKAFLKKYGEEIYGCRV